MDEMTKEIKRQAARWLIELTTADEITLDLWRFFERWLNLHPSHRAAYERAERAWHIWDSLVQARVSKK